MSEMLEAALVYASRDWYVFPCTYPISSTECSCGYDKCASIGKHPRIQGGLLNATTDVNQIKKWWKKWPQANVAIKTGAETGLVVLDVDPRHGGIQSLEKLQIENYYLPVARTIRTGSGGLHIYFAHPGIHIRNDQAGKLGAGLDIRGDGGYVLAPPSLHKDGGTYELFENKFEFPVLPEWIIKILNPPKPKRIVKPRPVNITDVPKWVSDELAENLQRLWTAPEGMRNNTLNLVAFRLGQLVAEGYLDQIDVENHLLSVGAGIGLDEREIRNTIISAMSAGEVKHITSEKKPDQELYIL